MKAFKPAVFAVLLAASFSSLAFDTTSGSVKRLYPSGNRVYFTLQDDTCALSNEYYFFESSNVQAKNWYGMLLAAGNTGKEIDVRLLGNCSDSGHKEIGYIYQDF